ncbi:iron-containing alcohol dehydrogenase [Sphingomonas bacterium]|uniref:iron-containing alcohol dehydrogenase n=1 Tax=Sphingomonas bacterium TaxID=1895847 RepID=UPI001576372D|nr:iron-containing alcohol dehydrogenase [Sphingomonas bacterium]
MASTLSLPRVVFGAGSLVELAAELALLGVTRPLLIADRGVERVGLVAVTQAAIPGLAASFVDVPENPTAAGADGALAIYRAARCDGVVALGGGSVLDTAKIVAALAAGDLPDAAALIGHPDLVKAVVPLVAIPTTLGTGSESSPVAALHLVTGGAGIGTRHPLLVPRVAVCDPDLTRTLPRRLIAATAIDALSHCIEGYFAEPANPVADALALDGAGRVFAAIHAALEPDGEAARASLMAAAFAGGAAIHKGLGPAHAIAFVCGDQDVHHGTLIGVALPHTVRLVAHHVPAKAARLATAVGLDAGAHLGEALAALVASLGLPATLSDAGYRMASMEAAVAAMVASHFNRTSPYVPDADQYRELTQAIA